MSPPVFSVTLASSSPQRRRILEELGIAFVAVEPGVPERMLPGAAETVLWNARAKACAVARNCAPGTVVLGADTVVSFENQVLGKPASPQEAAGLLMRFRGQTLRAYSGVAALSVNTGQGLAIAECAEFTLGEFPAEAVSWYVQSGEPLTRAGGLGISLLGEVLVTEIRGAYSCIAGLPKRATLRACSDPALGAERLVLENAVQQMLCGPWMAGTEPFCAPPKTPNCAAPVFRVQ